MGSGKEGRSPNRPCQWEADGKALPLGIIDPPLATADRSPPLLGAITSVAPPQAFLVKQGWGSVSRDVPRGLMELRSLYEHLQTRILEMIETLGEVRANSHYEVFRATEEDESVIESIVPAQREGLEKEIGELKLEAERIDREARELVGETPFQERLVTRRSSHLSPKRIRPVPCEEDRALLKVSRDAGNAGLPATAAATTAAATAITAAATAAFVATAATAATAITAAAAATIAAATTTAVAATTAATWTGFLGLRSIHAESAAVVIILVESLDGCIQLGLITKRHESESFGLPGFAVGDDFDPFNRSKSGEEAGDVSFSSSVGQVAHVDIHLIQF